MGRRCHPNQPTWLGGILVPSAPTNSPLLQLETKNQVIHGHTRFLSSSYITWTLRKSSLHGFGGLRDHRWRWAHRWCAFALHSLVVRQGDTWTRLQAWSQRGQKKHHRKPTSNGSCPPLAFTFCFQPPSICIYLAKPRLSHRCRHAGDRRRGTGSDAPRAVAGHRAAAGQPVGGGSKVDENGAPTERDTYIIDVLVFYVGRLRCSRLRCREGERERDKDAREDGFKFDILFGGLEA